MSSRERGEREKSFCSCEDDRERKGREIKRNPRRNSHNKMVMENL